MYPQYEVLIQNRRSESVDEEHSGLIAEFDEKGNLIRKIGDDNSYLFFHRSCMKPFQLAAISEIIDYYGLSDEEIAVSTGSHAGEDFHLKAIRSLLNKSGAEEKMLLCPPHFPLSETAVKNLIISNQMPSAIHHNCSGKHASMLAYCMMKGLDEQKYNDINHPLQQKIIRFVSDICEFPLKKCSFTKDGCTLPVIGTPLKNLAIGYIKLFTSDEFIKIKNAIISCPYHFGGENRTDTQIVIAGGGNLIAKVGAGNLCCVTDIREKTCIIIKIADSDNFARGYVLVKVLRMLNKLPDFDNSKLIDMFPEKITTDNGETVGKREITFTL